MRLALFGTAVLAGMLLVTADAGAQLAPQWRSCTRKPDVDWDQQIESCTTLIQSGGETTENRASAYNNRGNVYHGKGDNDRALADYSEAIRLDPKLASAKAISVITNWAK
jgi:tetratricopeptide (TPR) repeat protein